MPGDFCPFWISVSKCGRRFNFGCVFCCLSESRALEMSNLNNLRISMKLSELDVHHGYANIVCVSRDYSLREVDEKWLFICVGGNIAISNELASLSGHECCCSVISLFERLRHMTVHGSVIS